MNSPDPSKNRRRYSDDDRALALAAVAASGGNVARASRALGIPERTVAHWAAGERVHPCVAEMGERKSADLAERVERLAWELAGLGRAVTDELHAALPSMSGPELVAALRQSAVALGIVVDALAHLRARPEAGAPPEAFPPPAWASDRPAAVLALFARIEP